MKLLCLLFLAASLLFLSSLPARAAISVTSPYNGSTVGTTFTITASASPCSGQPISTIGFSMDASSYTASVSGAYLNTWASAGVGGHTIHFKSWGDQGAVCVLDVAIVVSSGASSSGGPSVASPTNGSSVSSPFTVSASAGSCSGQPVTTIGFSEDNSSHTATVSGTVLNASASSGTGGHTLHVKAWGNGGAVCDTDVAINVTGASGVPSGATTLSNVQAYAWSAIEDSGAGGGASGWSNVVGSPSLTGAARQFASTYWNYGGERYSASMSDDTNAMNFLWDGWVYIQNSGSDIANLEMDLNQVMANGQTVIMGFQCDGWSSTWDFTVNRGSATSPDDQWVHTGAYCNPRGWGVNQWHHVQIRYTRNTSGWVTYNYVTLDGNQQNVNVTAYSAFALGWGPVLLTNFQVDGATSGSSGSHVFLDNLTISRW
ncbi:MAG TPA: hypothetical protein VMD29_16190 [Terracidiphilus sp.]|nr:hypothetical protein [Terracidiphilus sp.]